MALELFDYSYHEKEFLKVKAQEWKLKKDNIIVFIERMLNEHNDKTNDILENELGFVSFKIRDSFSKNIFPKLRQEGFSGEDWEAAQKWLQETVFPKWISPFAWKQLWSMGKPNLDIKVEIVYKHLTAKSEMPDEYLPYQVPLGENVYYHIPMNEGEHLILLEKDGNDDVSCLQPSRSLKYKIGNPVAKEKLIAIVSTQKPQIEWWEEAKHAENFLQVNYKQIENLWNWLNSNYKSCQIWQFEVEVVIPKPKKLW